MKKFDIHYIARSKRDRIFLMRLSRASRKVEACYLDGQFFRSLSKTNYKVSNCCCVNKILTWLSNLEPLALPKLRLSEVHKALQFTEDV